MTSLAVYHFWTVMLLCIVVGLLTAITLSLSEIREELKKVNDNLKNK